MKWNDVYKKSNNSEYTQLVNIHEPVKLEANWKNFFSLYKIPIILILSTLIIMEFTTYKFEIKALLACIAVFIIAVLFFIYYNSYKILVKKNKMTIKAQFNDVEINCDDLITIFISRKKVFLFIIVPINAYYVNILYSKNKKPNIVTLPTIMNKKEDVYKFFKHFEFISIAVQSSSNATKNY